jgi:hypothetical protein
VKVAFALAKAVLELKEVRRVVCGLWWLLLTGDGQGMDENTNNVKKHIFAASELLLTVEAALNDYEGAGLDDEKVAIETFNKYALLMDDLDLSLTRSCSRELRTALEGLVQIKNQSRMRRFAVQEDDEEKIVNIFDNMKEARHRLMVGHL